MHRHLLLLFTAATVLLLLLPMASSLSAGESLSNCSRTFSCGNVVNVSYPFTGGDRPAYCGPPELHLSCDNYYPELTTDSLAYSVRALDQTRRLLILSRTDLDEGNGCLRQYANTTLNSTIFTFVSDNEVLTLFYECSNLTNINPDNQFTCKINGIDKDSYYLIGAVPTDPILNGSKCEVSVTVPIQPFAFKRAPRKFQLNPWLTQVLMESFEVNYTNPYDVQCVMCGGIGGGVWVRL